MLVQLVLRSNLIPPNLRRGSDAARDVLLREGSSTNHFRLFPARIEVQAGDVRIALTLFDHSKTALSLPVQFVLCERSAPGTSSACVQLAGPWVQY